MIELVAIFALTAGQSTCDSMQYSDAEEQDVVSLANEVLPDDLRNVPKESLNIEKCLDLVRDPRNQNGFLRRERLTYHASYPDESAASDLSTHRLIECRVENNIRDGHLWFREKTCLLVVKNLLSFPGIPEPVEFDDSVSGDDARRLLSYLATEIDSPIDGKPFTHDEFARISELGAYLYEDKRRFLAIYQKGCSTQWIMLEGEAKSPLDQFRISRDGSIC